jgi:hypothetical protein
MLQQWKSPNAARIDAVATESPNTATAAQQIGVDIMTPMLL